MHCLPKLPYSSKIFNKIWAGLTFNTGYHGGVTTQPGRALLDLVRHLAKFARTVTRFSHDESMCTIKDHSRNFFLKLAQVSIAHVSIFMRVRPKIRQKCCAHQTSTCYQRTALVPVLITPSDQAINATHSKTKLSSIKKKMYIVLTATASHSRRLHESSGYG